MSGVKPIPENDNFLEMYFCECFVCIELPRDIMIVALSIIDDNMIKNNFTIYRIAIESILEFNQ